MQQKKNTFHAKPKGQLSNFTHEAGSLYFIHFISVFVSPCILSFLSRMCRNAIMVFLTIWILLFSHLDYFSCNWSWIDAGLVCGWVWRIVGRLAIVICNCLNLHFFSEVRLSHERFFVESEGSLAYRCVASLETLSEHSSLSLG